jgi:hypothetical protein
MNRVGTGMVVGTGREGFTLTAEDEWGREWWRGSEELADGFGSGGVSDMHFGKISIKCRVFGGERRGNSQLRLKVKEG